ncbi:PREDICTED: G-type lectin S-receptor [Prunus dulcis]|uniref:PREDICTED: G-type lectin S-receptor n=1 Tax=Prunus dulcis TaxID=3755 RepID=A0A5E4FAZ8_PRUDU|nr:PREDICTED: G-type lectin S-receptor [Prunus dulcis]
MNAKISDFGMAKLFRKDELEANTSRIFGTQYILYEVRLLQLRGSTFTNDEWKEEHMLLWSERKLAPLAICKIAAYLSRKEDKGRECIDPSLDDSSSSCKLSRRLKVALLCVQENPGARPTMLEVYSMLKIDIGPFPTPTKMAFSRHGSVEAYLHRSKEVVQLVMHKFPIATPMKMQAQNRRH